MADSNKATLLHAALNRVTKWRTLLTGWQLGTRAKGDPEGDAVRDHRELTIMLRVEVSALVTILERKGVFTTDEWMDALTFEADELSRLFERKFPGVKATELGLHFDERAQEWMKKWRP
jgi:hypothetical protein